MVMVCAQPTSSKSIDKSNVKIKKIEIYLQPKRFISNSFQAHAAARPHNSDSILYYIIIMVRLSTAETGFFEKCAKQNPYSPSLPYTFLPIIPRSKKSPRRAHPPRGNFDKKSFSIGDMQNRCADLGALRSDHLYFFLCRIAEIEIHLDSAFEDIMLYEVILLSFMHFIVTFQNPVIFVVDDQPPT